MYMYSICLYISYIYRWIEVYRSIDTYLNINTYVGIYTHVKHREKVIITIYYLPSSKNHVCINLYNSHNISMRYLK